jgi:trehalose 6-phosphate phosphatase
MLLTAWPQVRERLRAARHVLLALDFDGTLAPIVERPEEAVLADGLRPLLQRLSGAKDYTVAVVSGRSLTDVRERADVPGVVYAGNHGMEIEGADARYTDPDAVSVRHVMEALIEGLGWTLAPVKGAIVEDKGLSLSVHYRLVAPARQPLVVEEVRRAVASLPDSGRVVLREGKKVVEVRPALSWDKGKAIAFLSTVVSERLGQAPLPVYVGDDVTDEDAFREVNAQDGLSIVVGLEGRTSVAKYGLASIAQVKDFLELLLSIEAT